MKKVLYIGNNYPLNDFGGRQSLSKLNHDVLKKIFKSNFFSLKIAKKKPNFFKSFFGYIDGINEEYYEEISKKIHSNNIDFIFIDGSNLGLIAKKVKQDFPHVKIYTFFHNIETLFFLWSLKSARSIKSFFVLIINYLAERKSSKFSDFLICLSNRDSENLFMLFKKKASYITPICIVDEFRKYKNIKSENSLLFVGSKFYGNIKGLDWFIEKVMRHIKFQLIVVGRGMEEFRHKYNKFSNVTIVGTSSDLNSFYSNCVAVVAPIFDGSGMKTKVAEALMFGKEIYGTPEAFTGYEKINELKNFLCINDKDFISKINLINTSNISLFNQKYRDLYTAHFSMDAHTKRFLEIFNE